MRERRRQPSRPLEPLQRYPRSRRQERYAGGSVGHYSATPIARIAGVFPGGSLNGRVGRQSAAIMEMHSVPEEEVRPVVARAGGRLTTLDRWTEEDGVQSNRYWVTR